MSNEVNSGHVRMVEMCEGALTELFADRSPQVVILAGEKISTPLVGLLGLTKGPIDLPIDSHRPGSSNDTSKAVIGDLEGIRVAVIQGRIHANEGGDYLSSVVIPRAAAGAAKDAVFLVLNAATGLSRPYSSVGQVAIVGDHISSFAGINPLKGESAYVGRFGSPHVTIGYDRELRWKAAEALSQTKTLAENLSCDAVYLMAPGPQLPTLAELKLYAAFGADVVGTPLPEVLVLNQMSRRVLVISLVVGTVFGNQLAYDDRVAKISGYAEEFAKRIAGLLPQVAPAVVDQKRVVSA